MDEGLLSISVGCGQIVKMLITLEPHDIFDYIYNFDIGRENDKEKKKNIKKKYWSRPDSNHCAPGCWITRSLLDHSATTYDIHTRAI